MAGSKNERQEYGFIEAVNNSTRDYPVSIVSKREIITNVNIAKKYEGRQLNGSEPLTDIQLITEDSMTWNISMKGERSPSLAGGGMRGLDLIVPDLLKKFNISSYNSLIDNGYREGDNPPNIFSKIPYKYKKKIITGNLETGGPIHYLYIGPMNVVSNYESGFLTINGNLIKVDDFVREHEFYFRLRKRRSDQMFVHDIDNGFYRIFGRSPRKGDIGGRLVITNKVPVKAFMVEIDE